MASGTIKTKTDKGFGFITVEGSDDVFFHHTACNGQYDALQVGQTVNFDIQQGDKGPKAANVVAGGQSETRGSKHSADADATDMSLAA